MKTKMIIASLAIAALAITSCKSSGDSNEKKESRADKKVSCVDAPTPKTFTDSVAMYQGIFAGAQALDMYDNLIPSLKKDFNKDLFLAGMKYILESDTSSNFRDGMHMGLQMLSMVEQASGVGVELDPKIAFGYFAKIFMSDSITQAEKNKMLPEMEDVMNRFQEQMMMAQYEQQAKMQAQYRMMFDNNVTAGKKFIAEKQKDPQVKTTQSGLAYKVTKLGTGAKASKDGTAKVIYTGKHIDGTVFDSSNNKGVEFDLKQVVPGFAEALSMFPVGSVVELYIPTELAYGEGGSGVIEPGETLIFEIEIVE